jgi:drug/metabolite transporter (DMT)-like permease
MNPTKSSNWLLNYIVLGIIWGSSFFFIMLALRTLPPIGIAFWRTAIGAATLAVILAIQKVSIPKSAKQWGLLWASGLLMSGIPAVLFGFAEQHVSSALASIMNASTPVFTVLAIMIAFRAEKPKPQVLAGLGLGLVGVFVVLGIWQGFGTNDPLAVGALILAVTFYGFGSPFVRKFIEPLKLDPKTAVFGQVSTSALSLLPFYLAGPLTTGPASFESLAGMLALGVLGTGIAYVLYYRLLATVGSPIASAVTYVTPVVGVAIGVALLHETISWHEPVGAIIIILGAAVAQGRFNRLLARK